MGGRIPEEIIEQIRSKLDIIDVASQYVTLKKSGRNYLGLCPFHSENTPSFTISKEKQIFYCFGCSVGGDIFRFLMEMEKYTFIEAVEYLAGMAKVTLPDHGIEARGGADGETSRLREVLDCASQFYHHVLFHTSYGESALQYLLTRGLLRETLLDFQIGFSPDSPGALSSYLKRRGYENSLLEKAGLVIGKERDRFRGRIMFPIHDSRGRVIGFGGRLITDGQPKYLNSPETPSFRKSSVIFNLHRARSYVRKEKTAILFEGYMDVISAWQGGIRNGVASLGTSLTEGQAKIMKRNAETAILAYDADTAGWSATMRGIEVLKKQQCHVKVALLPAGYDPDDYIRKHGGEGFRQRILTSAISDTAFRLEKEKQDFDLQDENGRIQYLTKAMQIISELPQAIERDHYMRKLAIEFEISLDALKEEGWRLQRKKKEKRVKESNKGYNNDHSKQTVGHFRPLAKVESSEPFLLAYMMKDPSLTRQVQSRLGDRFYTDSYAALAAYLYAYYSKDQSEETGSFIQSLSDSELISLACKLEMMELPTPVSPAAIEDYIRDIENVPIQKEIEDKEREAKQLDHAGEHVKAAQLFQEVTQMKRKIYRRN